MIRSAAILLLCVLSLSASAQPDTEQYVLLVSFDGFRYDYARRDSLPNFLKMIGQGASAASMIPSYPSKTFPNHYTLVTGLYPGHHGLVDNTFYDSVTDKTYAIRKREMVRDPFYYGGTPVWQLAQQHGMRSASFFWVGSEAPVKGSFPDYYRYYDDDFPDRKRIETVLEWFQLPEEARPRFISLYFSVVDHVTHDFGPDAEESRQAILYADSLLGELLTGVEALDLPVNIIVVSDHGMYPMKGGEDTYLKLDEMMSLPKDSLRLVNNETHVHIYCEEPLKSRLIRELKENESNYRAFLREDTPEEWQYNAHYRIGDIVLEAAPGYSFLGTARRRRDYGSHGYDPYHTPEMQAIFYASGPAIKRGVQIPSFENVHVYSLITWLLGIPAVESDGSIEVLKPILRE